MSHRDLLFEIGCEELPANNLYALAEQLGAKIIAQFKNAQLAHGRYQIFATPRRLGILIKQLSTQQPDIAKEKRGPALKAPEQALNGFIASCDTTKDQLTQENGYWFYRYVEPGKATSQLLPDLLRDALKELHLSQSMHWGAHTTEFVRPVQWVTLVFGNELITTEILGKKTIAHTYGHHFHFPNKVLLAEIGNYADILEEEGFVIADFDKRKKIIAEQMQKLAKQHDDCYVLVDEKLLDEVTGLVEWPVALWCKFSDDFLSIPKEALISSMQHHQKCFPVENKQKKLLPYFITISNIQSRDPEQVIHGNQRVMHARLSDAKFFYEEDKKIKLIDRLPLLKNVTFQQKLGSMLDKSQRVTKLTKEIYAHLGKDNQSQHAERAGLLCKTDLLTHMVGEFPELQGIMGSYYAQHDGENEAVATAIREHYLPRFAKDALPQTTTGSAVALADRVDTLVGIFGIGLAPTGDKDPFGLRRAALGVIRILIEQKIHIHLSTLLSGSTTVAQFILDRLPAYYQEQHIAPDTIQAAIETQADDLYDLHLRIMAVNEFRHLTNARALAEANKRVKNILQKQTIDSTALKIDQTLLHESAEKMLFAQLQKTEAESSKDYLIILRHLSALHEPIDLFFKDVMVDVEDQKLKTNRLALLQLLRKQFLQVADISLLQL